MRKNWYNRSCQTSISESSRTSIRLRRNEKCLQTRSSLGGAVGPSLRAVGPGDSAHIMYYVYVLESLRDKRKYIGQTNDLDARITLHNRGRVKSTSNRRPLKLIYCEEFASREESVEREKFFKSHAGYNFLCKSGIYQQIGE